MNTDNDGRHEVGLLNGTAPASEEDDPEAPTSVRSDEAPREFTAPPDEVADLSAACAKFVRAKFGVPLDGTSDTLGLLDQYVRDARAELRNQPASLPLVTATIGAYFGEVLRRSFDSSWFATGSHEGWRLDFADVYLTFNPLGMAREALTLEEADGWHAHIEMDDAERDSVLARLAQLPMVADEEYYAPSTRFDVVEIAVAALRARAHEAGLSGVRFTGEDYRRK
jgi:hypothetical protein